MKARCREAINRQSKQALCRLGFTQTKRGTIVVGHQVDADTVLRSLRANVEFLDGNYGNVYLDNARPYGMNERMFRSCLSNLIKRGLYEPVDGFVWGRVRIE